MQSGVGTYGINAPCVQRKKNSFVSFFTEFVRTKDIEVPESRFFFLKNSFLFPFMKVKSDED